MGTKKLDLLCIQESKIPSNSFFRYKDDICIASTNIKGGDDKSKSINRVSTAKPSEKEPTIATGTGTRLLPKTKRSNAVLGLSGPIPVAASNSMVPRPAPPGSARRKVQLIASLDKLPIK